MRTGPSTKKCPQRHRLHQAIWISFRPRREFLSVFAGCVLAMPLAWSQQSSPAPAPPTIERYDVASIHVNAHSTAGNGQASWSNGSLTVRNLTFHQLLRFAYGFQAVTTEGIKPWMDENTFDIQAKTEGFVAANKASMPEDQREAYDAKLRVPFQNLLVDRFQLKTHQQGKLLPVYRMVVAKGGLKMQTSGDSSGHYGFAIKGPGHFTGSNVTMDQIAQFLVRAKDSNIERPIVDGTSLPGKYTFDLSFTPEFGRSNPDDNAPSLFTALQEQLGLKLETDKAVIEITVIDSAELPSEN